MMRKQPLNNAWLLLGLVWLTLAACSQTQAQSNQAQATPIPLSLECYVAYRSSVTVGIEREETLTFSAADDTQVLTFSQLKFQAQYGAGAEPWAERSLRVSITPTDREAELTAQLYQISKTEALQNQFIGGHGFTGLHYVYHPDSGAELQYWCVAQ